MKNRLKKECFITDVQGQGIEGSPGFLSMTVISSLFFLSVIPGNVCKVLLILKNMQLIINRAHLEIYIKKRNVLYYNDPTTSKSKK